MSAGLAPQVVSGVDDSWYSRVPPVLTKDSGSQGREEPWPFTFRPVTYCVAGAAPGALITMLCPLGRSIVTCSNSGLPSTSSALPGIIGYIPIADHTYHDDICPRSSFPAIPLGPGPYSSLRARRTTCWALYGAPA